MSSPPAVSFRYLSRLQRTLAAAGMRALVAIGSCAAAGMARAQVVPFEGAAPGMIEAGIPAFVVLGPESIGLSGPPTDLRQMPDGRMLVVARTELALGDGVRWEVYRQADSERGHDTVNVAIGTDGVIYAGVDGGFGRVDFGPDGKWRLTAVAALPAGDAKTVRHVPTNVIVTDGGWYWHSGSGAVISWQPGATPRIVGDANTVGAVFTLGSDRFISNRSDGSLLRATGDRVEIVIPAAHTTPNDTITCGTVFDATHLLVGTNAEGLKLFDGAQLSPFPAPGLPANRRINDLCGTGGGYFAAALDNTGIVFLDDAGHIVQTLDRNLDNRLGRVQRLFYASGSLWALLNEGIARIRFPSRLSGFESLVATGLSSAQPIRHEGRLWLRADGRAQRGIYSPEGRLLRFVDDSPTGSFVHSLSTQLGPLTATNETGIYRLREGDWQLVAPGIPYARIDVPSVDGRRWLYVARDELGWITGPDDGFAVTRFPHPGLGDVYGVFADATGAVWLELGYARIGRIRCDRDEPRLEIFTSADGVTDGWVNIFIIDGRAYFNIAAHLFHFDETQRRLTDDTELVRRYPAMAGIVGRPVRDSRGRLWVTANGSVHIVTDAPSTGDEELHVGGMPFHFTVEKDGVMWLHETRRLLRYDPAIPEPPPPPPLRAILSQVHLSTSDRHLFAVGSELAPLPYSDNSLVVHYLAPGAPFGQSVTFEVRLDGTGSDWLPSGSTGSTAFNRLKEGRYTLRVRPRLGSTLGEETTLAFSIRPPWFRTPLAYVLYFLSAAALVLGCAWWLSYLDRREKARLEYLVGERTSALNDANTRLERQVHETLDKAAALSASEERFRKLNEDLERRVQDRTAELTASNRELEAFSYSISHDLRAPLRNISGFADLLRRRLHEPADTETARFLNIVSSESVRLGQLIDALLVFSRLGRSELKLQPVMLLDLVEQSRTDLAADIGQRPVEFRVGSLPTVLADPTLLRQVFANLLSNALKFTRGRTPAVIEIGATPGEKPDEQIIFVRDNGVGFDPKYTEKLFGVFQRLHHAREFEGTGIGLANVRRIIVRHGGRVWAEGHPGEGATIYFTLPGAAAGPA
ncbi:MAG TPA: ATP-binding protein [Opitutaceae bacterium]|nr:ATP-binding protein [Opitutaceae bacterium]